MICPYCAVGFRPEWTETIAGVDPRGQLHTTACNCTECGHLVIRGQWHTQYAAGLFIPGGDELAIFPTSPLRPVPPEVTGEYAQDFREAALVLDHSPKASAAISRRLLQHTIREKAGIKKHNLDEEIQALIDSNALPADLAHDLDALRTVGNFAAHPIKSTNTGEVVDVEPGEAEWLLELLEELLDFYFVRPTVRQKRRDALNAKLQDAGKADLKGTEPPQPPPVLGQA